MILKSKSLLVFALILLSGFAVFAISNGAWMDKVPNKERDKANPFGSQAEAVAAGQHIFHDHCAHCHGADAEGTKKRPSLRTERVQQQATEGDLHWLLVNGDKSGMPTWSKLGDPQIWQVIAYVRSLKVETAAK